MAPIWPFKKYYKTNIKVHISLKRPPDGLTDAKNIKVQIDQKWPNVHLKKSKTAARSSIWPGQKCI